MVSTIIAHDQHCTGRFTINISKINNRQRSEERTRLAFFTNNMIVIIENP